MESTEMDISVSEEMDVSVSQKPDFSCELCKISYTSESELNEHNWSLMHHIKLEKKKKGSIHNCTLCFTTSSNIIEYGKHLNGDKHKRAIEDNRRQKDEEDLLMGKNILFAKLKQKEADSANKVKESEAKKVDSMETQDSWLKYDKNQRFNQNRNAGQKSRPFRGKFFRGHQRSFSNPIPVISNHQPQYNQNKNTRDGNRNSWNNWNRQENYDSQYGWQDSWSNQGQHFDSYNNVDYSQDFEWNNFSGQQGYSFDLETYEIENSRMNNSFENPNYHRSLDKFLASPLLPPPDQQRQYEDFLPPEALPNFSSMGNKDNTINRNKSYGDDELDHFPSQLSKDYDRDRGSQRRERDRSSDRGEKEVFKTPEPVRSRSRTSQDENSPEDSTGQKRRRSNEGHQSRKERRYDSPSQSPSRDFLKDSPRDVGRGRYYQNEESRWSGERSRRDGSEERSSSYSDSRHRNSSYSDRRQKESRKDSTRYQNDGKRSVRFSDEVSSESSKVTDEADSTTDIDSSSKSTSRESKTEKKKSTGGIMKKKKSVRSPSSSPRLSPTSGRKSKSRVDEGSSVLEKAEKLCKELRDKREKAKKEREKKERQKKFEKQEEINEQLRALSERSKEYVKGHVSTEEEKLSNIDAMSDSGRSVSSSVISDNCSSMSTDQGIEKIRKNIELSVVTPVSDSDKSGKSHSDSRKDSSPEALIGVKIIPETSKKKSSKDKEKTKTSKESADRVESEKSKSTSTGEKQSQTSTSKSKEKEGLSTESLLKMVNSPRSRKERLKLAEMLRSYASSHNRLSMPRFNLQLSGMYDKLETQMEDLHLEELSPDVQLQIAQLIEADIKPDINELEMALFCDSTKATADISKELHRTDSNEISSTTPTSTSSVSTKKSTLLDQAVDQFQELNAILEKENRRRSRTLSSGEDHTPVVNSGRSPLSVDNVHIKQEPIDSGYGNSSSGLQSGSDKGLDYGGSAVVSSSGVSDMDTGEAPRDEIGEKTQNDPPTSTIPSGDVSAPQSVSSSHSAESIFDTMYDMSVKEETIRNELKDVYGQIDYLKKVIEEASIQLNRYTEKKIRLEKDEGDLRKNRLKILQDAKLMHRSNQTTPMSSDVEMTPDTHTLYTTPILPSRDTIHTQGIRSDTAHTQGFRNDAIHAQGLRSDAIHTQGLRTDTAHTQVLRKDAVHTQVPDITTPDQHTSPTPISSKSFKHVEAERDKIVTTATKPSHNASNPPQSSTSNNWQSNSGIQSSDPLLQQLQDLSSSLRDDVQKASSQTSPNRDDSYFGSVDRASSKKGKNKHVDSEQISVNCDMRKNNITGALSPEVHREQEDTSAVKSSRPPVESKSSHVSEPGVPMDQSDGHSELPSVSEKQGRVGGNSDSEVSKSTELQNAGFVTLNSLLRNTDGSDGTAQPHGEQSVDASGNTNNSGAGSGVTPTGSRPLSFEYMGSIPTRLDYTSFFESLQGQGRCVFVGGDQSSNVLQKIESLMSQRNSLKEGEEPQKDKTEDILKKLRVIKPKEQGSEYDSVNSNCSLGTKISRYAKKGELKTAKTSKKDKTKKDRSESESGSDRTLQGDAVVLSDSSTPVKAGKESAITHSSYKNMTLRSSRKGVEPAEHNDPGIIGEDKSISPSKKKLKSKKERDRRSVRKKKEEFVIDSSSDGNAYEGEGIPRLSDVRQQLEFKSVSDVPVSAAVEVSEFDEACLVETGSESTSDMVPQHPIKSEPRARKKSLLDDVQLDSMTESEDSRTKVANNTLLSERFRLKPDAIQNLQSTVKTTLQRTRNTREQKFTGPVEVVTGLQVVGNLLYVAYQMNCIKCFNMETGEVVKEYMCYMYSVNCIVVSSSQPDQLVVGCSQYTMIVFNCLTGEICHKEETEGNIQCLHEDWGKLFLGTDCGTVIVKKLKVQNNKTLDTFLCTDRAISCITSARQGSQKMLVIGSFDAVIYVYDSSSGLLIHMLEGHTHTPFSIQVVEQSVYSGSGDKTVMEHNLMTGELIWICNDASSIVSNVAVSGDMLFSASYDRYIRCYDLKSKKLSKVFYGADIGLVTKMLVQDGKLITGNRKGIVESIQISSSNEFPCQQNDCDFIFGLRSHLEHHAVHGHLMLNDKVFHCMWNGCNTKIPVDKDRKEAESHMKSHIIS